MEAIRLHTKVEADGEVTVRGLPCHRGEEVELILLVDHPVGGTKKPLSASRLSRSPLVGIWKGREDLGDSRTFARGLREQAQRRSR